MSVKPEIELTADGSHTLFVPELDEHYHSINGAIQESEHIYINAGLHCCSKKEIYIFEVGFGTGLNAFLTLLDAQNSEKVIHYISIEKYPLSDSITSKLNYGQKDQNLFNILHQSLWNQEIEITPNFFLTKIEADFTSFDFDRIKYPIDVIYFDAFAPQKQSDMWSLSLFSKLYGISNNDAILVTYCAKGIVRRMLQEVGYTVERLPGPPGKREILRARKLL